MQTMQLYFHSQRKTGMDILYDCLKKCNHSITTGKFNSYIKPWCGPQNDYTWKYFRKVIEVVMFNYLVCNIFREGKLSVTQSTSPVQTLNAIFASTKIT